VVLHPVSPHAQHTLPTLHAVLRAIP
jgi:hypothetical protein